MKSDLINAFRNRINDTEYVLHTYHDRNGKDCWSIICSAMDWISVVVESIDASLLTTNNDNESSIKVITFLSCIDIMWEGVQQLHRVFFNTTKIPFLKERKIFKHNPTNSTDNDYFKTIRACFAAHPINLHDCFDISGKKEKRYASWSGGKFSEGDFSVILYSNEPGVESSSFDIYFDELMEFAQKRYEYLSTIMSEIDRQEKEYFDAWRRIPIEQSDDILKRIDILLHELGKRLDNDYYRYELEKIKLFFTVPIKSPSNRAKVQEYRQVLECAVAEIGDNLQLMRFEDLSTHDETWPTCPIKYNYYLSKLSDAVWGQGHWALIYSKPFEELLCGIIDCSEFDSITELYVLVETGLFLLGKK